MDTPTVVVSYGVDADMRRVNTEVLGESARLVFARDLGEPEREAAFAEAEVLVSWGLAHEVPASTLVKLDGLRLLQLVSAGIDHLDFTSVPAQVMIASNVGAYAEPMAEQVMAMVLACAKRLPERRTELANGTFDQRSLSLTLDGAICAIVGFGGIGKAVARLMRAFGARIWALNTSGRTEERVDFVGTLDDLPRAISEADVVVLSLPLTRATRGLVSERELALMKPRSILVNVARGAVIDERALYEHLRANPEFWAAIDTWWKEPRGLGEFHTEFPFLELPNVIGTPHNSPLVAGILTVAARRAAENVKRFIDGQEMSGVARREDYLGGDGDGGS